MLFLTLITGLEHKTLIAIRLISMLLCLDSWISILVDMKDGSLANKYGGSYVFTFYVSDVNSKSRNLGCLYIHKYLKYICLISGSVGLLA